MIQKPPHDMTPVRLQPVAPWHVVWAPVFLAAVAIALAALYLAVRKVDYHYPDLIRPEFISFVNLTGEANLPTWFSALLWQTAALLAFSIAQAHREKKLPNVGYWFGMVPLFLFLSLDEAAMVHENVGDLIARRAALPDVFNYTFAWVLFGVGLVAVVGLIYLRFLLRLQRVLALLFVSSAAVFVFASVGIEFGQRLCLERQARPLPSGLDVGPHGRPGGNAREAWRHSPHLHSASRARPRRVALRRSGGESRPGGIGRAASDRAPGIHQYS